ncbi:DUF6194 family protein [Fimbriiglobus ruber]|uniref:DUF6194 family protein n=1 Tax=Fimbriiglobus ruber TaxID=1908690 RepID=UPI000B4AA7A1|nr:DUF6194 family protein [Fimbriiglobus ruber]
MDESAITQFITDTFAGVDVLVACREDGSPEIAWGDSFFYYDPNRDLPKNRRMPFATIVTKDYDGFDCASNLNRPGVFRLNVAASKQTVSALFGTAKPEDHDFTALDRIMPHPVYGKMYWVCVLNPSVETFRAVQPLLADAYQLAVSKYAKREDMG